MVWTCATMMEAPLAIASSIWSRLLVCTSTLMPGHVTVLVASRQQFQVACMHRQKLDDVCLRLRMNGWVVLLCMQMGVLLTGNADCKDKAALEVTECFQNGYVRPVQSACSTYWCGQAELDCRVTTISSAPLSFLTSEL